MSDLVGNRNCWFLLKIFTLYNLEKICILHGHVFVMVIISYTITKTCPCNIQRIFFCCKNENSQCTNFEIFLIFAQNIDCGYTLGPPRRGGSNEFLKSLFRSTKFHIMITFLIKCKSVKISSTSSFLCPQFRKKLRGHIGFGLSVQCSGVVCSGVQSVTL